MFENRPISPPCFVLPAQINVSLDQDIKARGSQYFILKSLGTISTSLHNWKAMKSLSDKKRYGCIILLRRGWGSLGWEGIVKMSNLCWGNMYLAHTKCQEQVRKFSVPEINCDLFP